MNVLAYCAQSFRDSVREAAGVEPLCSPPLTMDLFDATRLQQAHLVYIKFHAVDVGPRQPNWYGDYGVNALTPAQILPLDLSHTAFFIANCHSFHIQDRLTILSPMVQACLQAGARAVVCGTGQHYARSQAVDGCDLLGRYFRIHYTMHLSPTLAFRLARARLALSSRQDLAITSSLAFRIFTRSNLL